MKIKLREHLPEILTGVGVAGEIGADILFVRAGKLEDKDKDKKHYILPSIVSGVSIAAIIFSNRISAKDKAALVGALGLSALESARYKKAVKDTVTPEELQQIEDKYDESEFNDLMAELDEQDKEDPQCKKCLDDDPLFYFPQIHLIVRARADDVHVALLNLNETFEYKGGEATVNDFYNSLTDINPNIEKYIKDEDRQDADKFGWKIYEDDPEAGLTKICFEEYTRQLLREPVTVIKFQQKPLFMTEWEEYYDKLWEEYTSSVSVQERC